MSGKIERRERKVYGPLYKDTWTITAAHQYTQSRPSSSLPLSSMAPFSNFISFLFLTTLLLSLQINARDSQFFSKVTHVVNNNNNNNVKETQLPYNEGPVNKPEQRPVFIPETETNYGLYGHESGLHPPTTTTTTTNAAPYTTTTNTYQQYKTESEEETSKYPSSNYYNKDAYAYGDKQNEFSETKYTEGGYNSMANQHNNNQKYYYNKNAANDRYFYNNKNAANDRYSYNSNAANNRYNGEKQGLSDTRFMEGGKYFYDVNFEKYNPTLYDGSAGGVNTENWYNNKGYFGNKNGKSYQNKNSMEGYQNQEEFEDDQDNFDP